MICQSCRARLLTTARKQARRPKRLLRGYASSGSAKDIAVERLEDLFDPGSGVPQIPQDARDAWARQRQASEARSKPAHRENLTLRQADSIRMFEKIVAKQRPSVPSPEAEKTNSDKALREAELAQKLIKLKEMLGRGVRLKDCYQHLQDEIWEHRKYAANAELLQTLVSRIHTGLLKTKSRSTKILDLPSWYVVTLQMDEMGVLEPQKWADMVIDLVLTVQNPPTQSDEEAASSQTLARLQDDLVSAWLAMFRCGRPAAVNKVIQQDPDTFRFPPLQFEPSEYHQPTRRTVDALSLLFPQYRSQSLRDVYYALLLTYALLTDKTRVSQSVLQKAQPMLDTVSHVLRVAKLADGPPQLVKAGQGAADEYLAQRWASIRETVAKAPISEHEPTSALQGFVGRFQTDRQLAQARDQEDHGRIEKSWTAFWAHVERSKTNGNERSKVSQEIFNRYIRTYAALRKFDRAADVWDKMVSLGLPPTDATWNHLLDGYREAKDLRGLEAIWQGMIESGVQPDIYMWTTRISGLVQLGGVEPGLKALKELVRVAAQDAKTQSSRVEVASTAKPSETTSRFEDAEAEGNARDQVAKPRPPLELTIEPINAAVAALLRRNEMSAGRQILAWAAQQGLEPDVRTYNILLPSLLKSGQIAQAQSLVATMARAGVQVDSATFTIIMDGILPSIGELQPSDQASTIENFLDQMEQAKVKVGSQMYTKLIHGLLRNKTNTQPAIDATLKRMQRSGTLLSTEIETIFVDSHFAERPPNVDAVWNIIRNGGAKDRVFWDAVVRGFATMGDSANAWYIMTERAGSSYVPTLTVAHRLLKVLLGSGETDKAAKLVGKLKKSHTQNEGTQIDPGRFWRHGLWDTAGEHGLVDLEKLRKPR